jgi:hypothetical protein
MVGLQTQCLVKIDVRFPSNHPIIIQSRKMQWCALRNCVSIITYYRGSGMFSNAVRNFKIYETKTSPKV